MKKTISRLETTFQKRDKDDKIMSLFITAGYPNLDSTVDLILGFEKNGADIIYDTDDDNIPYNNWGFPEFKTTKILKYTKGDF